MTDEFSGFMGDESLTADPTIKLEQSINAASATSLIAPCDSDTGQGWQATLAFVDATAARTALESGTPQVTIGHVMGAEKDAHFPGAVVPSDRFTTGVCFQQAKP